MTQEGFLIVLLLLALLLLGVTVVAAIFLGYKYLSVKGQIGELARNEFELWRTRELDVVKQETLEMARRQLQAEFEQWKISYEQSIRQDAIQKSQSVTFGKVTEQLAPYLPGFSYNPKDARFIGSPIDFIVFDGLNDDDDDIRKIVFVEVKTGSSALSARGRRVRNAVQSGNVEWCELRLPMKMGDTSTVNRKQIELSNGSIQAG